MQTNNNQKGDISTSVKQVESIFKQTAEGFAFSYELYDNWLDTKYDKEENRAMSIRLLSFKCCAR